MQKKVASERIKYTLSWPRIIKRVKVPQLVRDNGTALDIEPDDYFKDKVAVITGASSGIGKELAYQLAARGAVVDICARNEEKLATIVDSIKKAGLRADYHVVDVTEKDQVTNYAENIVRKYGRMDIAINNAGIGVGGLFLEVPLSEIERLFDVNLWGTIYGTRAFLPFLCNQPQSNLVNIASIGGMIASSGYAPYNMSKFAVRGLNESLQQEYQDISNITISGVYPGNIKTEIMEHVTLYLGETDYSEEDKYSNFNRLAKTSVEKASKIIAKGIEKGKKRIIVGADALALDYLSRIAPVGYQKVLMAAFRLRVPVMYKAYHRLKGVR